MRNEALEALEILFLRIEPEDTKGNDAYETLKAVLTVPVADSVTASRWDRIYGPYRPTLVLADTPAAEPVCECDIHFSGVAITGVCKCGHASHAAGKCTAFQPADDTKGGAE